MNFDRFEQWELSHDSSSLANKKPAVQKKCYNGIAAQLGVKPISLDMKHNLLKRSHSSPDAKISVKKKQKRPIQLSKNTNQNFSTEIYKEEKNCYQKQTVNISELENGDKFLRECKEISRRKKVEEWLKQVEYSPVPQPPSKIRKESSPSALSLKKQESSKQKTVESKAIARNPVLVVESDCSADGSSKENKQDYQRFNIIHSCKIPQKDKSQTVNKELDKTKKDLTSEAVKTRKGVKPRQAESPKKMRPASFILKSTGVNESSQTDISSLNLKQLQNCDMPKLFDLNYKYTIDLKHDMFAHHTSGAFYDSKGNDLTPWFEHIVDNYQQKSKCIINKNSNCFITLSSRFKVFETKDFDHLELVHIIDSDDTKKADKDLYCWIKDFSEPIRIHILIDKVNYKQVLGEENSSKLPGMVITRVFP